MYPEEEAKRAHNQGPALTPMEERGPTEIDKRVHEGVEINYMHHENAERLARIVRKLRGPAPEDPNKEGAMKEPDSTLEAFDHILNTSRRHGNNVQDLITQLEQLI